MNFFNFQIKINIKIVLQNEKIILKVFEIIFFHQIKNNIKKFFIPKIFLKDKIIYIVFLCYYLLNVTIFILFLCFPLASAALAFTLSHVHFSRYRGRN